MIHIRRLALCVVCLLLAIGCSSDSLSPPGPPNPDSPSPSGPTKSDTQNKPDTEAAESELSESSPVTAGSAQNSGTPAAVGEKTTELPQESVDSPVAAQPAPVEHLPFEEAILAERIVWEPVNNVEITTKTADGSKTESTAFQVKFKYDENGKQNIDTTGYKTYTWPSRQAIFGPGAVIRLTQNSEVREGAIRAGEEWTWTGQLWTAKPKELRAEAPLTENVEAGSVVNEPRYVPVLWRKPASSDGGSLGALLNIGTLSEPDHEAFSRRQGRDAEILKEHLRLWESALGALEASPKNNQALLINLTLHDGLYVDDEFQPEKSKLYLKRMAGLAPASIEQWQAALALSKTEAVWSLVQQEPLFESDIIKIASFEKLVTGLGEQTAQQARADRLRQEEEENARVELEAKNLAMEEARQLDVEKAKWRTWTSTDGIHRTEAKFVTFIGGTVTLEKKDGKTVKVPIDKLVEEDQQFIRQRKWLK